jgi:hypothetical protein
VLNLIDYRTKGLTLMHSAGHASCHVSTAFACFLMNDRFSDPDLFVLGGDMSQGEVLRVSQQLQVG